MFHDDVESIFNGFQIALDNFINDKYSLDSISPKEQAVKKFELIKGGKNINITEDPKLAQKHTHQMAIAIDTLMKIVTGVELEHDAVYLQKRKYHTKDGIDDLIGFNPNCILR